MTILDKALLRIDHVQDYEWS